ncbi:MAG TPA: gluconate 2-dehydrogenase subunit 3 family protein [Vicinamibacterales bacterium]|nr:gluconate 2-dehydrogenase subunit 3 family protein [Vicinamibacterales bacterium]
MDTLMTRRDAIERVIAVFGGVGLLGGDHLLSATFDLAAQNLATTIGVGEFTAADVALLDEVAETLLPETSTPGAKAARTGAFMALMVTAAYTPANQQVFRDGMRLLDEECRRTHGAAFMQASPEQRLALLEQLDREQRAFMEARSSAPRSRAPAPAPRAADAPAHYFRMMKELALLGYFTSEIGCTQAQRYVESPGRFDPCVPYAPGDRSWAPHA